MRKYLSLHHTGLLTDLSARNMPPAGDFEPTSLVVNLARLIYALMKLIAASGTLAFAFTRLLFSLLAIIIATIELADTLQGPVATPLEAPAVTPQRSSTPRTIVASHPPANHQFADDDSCGV
ncbi:hypothetical protein NM688_g8661 [Phlebia brevispora]|uniref:Uncharacterized protein n=1 Tax=Phlebia brevispora TaxID=194682 RepID=A0ACC1RSQ3_9APHY|nr:hypothetical protein NM688_g8661 [Phlebia brevispora]